MSAVGPCEATEPDACTCLGYRRAKNNDGTHAPDWCVCGHYESQHRERR